MAPDFSIAVEKSLGVEGMSSEGSGIDDSIGLPDEDRAVTSGHADTHVPERGPDGLRHWLVAGGVIRNEASDVLLVQNRRRNGELDWSPPGGVVDPGETPKGGLTREVMEETGLQVAQWEGPLYRVEVTAPGFGFFLQVEAFRSVSHAGTLLIEDPDQIVVSASFVAMDEAIKLLDSAPRWVAEPLIDYFDNEITDGRLYAFDVAGESHSNQTVTRRT